MSKLLTIAVLLSLWTSTAAAGDMTLSRPIDLDNPGALEALQPSNPAHYEKVRQIVAGIVQQADAKVPGWMLANFNARDVNYAPIEMTSYPPKRRLAFALDDTRYVIVVTLTRGGRITPLSRSLHPREFGLCYVAAVSKTAGIGEPLAQHGRDEGGHDNSSSKCRLGPLHLDMLECAPRPHLRLASLAHALDVCMRALAAG